MLFTGLEFLFLFLPITMGIYYILPTVFRNYWLLIASLFFYAWGEPVFLAFMVLSIVFNYLMAMRIDEIDRRSPLRKVMLVVDVIGNLSVLFVYKYMNFFTATMHEFFPATQKMFPQTNYVLPIGISFFTFQAMSYVIDVYRGGERGAKVQKNPAYVGMYVSFFPQLIAGPIVRYTTIEHQLENRTITWHSFSEGVYRFVIGFNKKMLLANLLSVVADKAFAEPDLSVAMAWAGIISYTLQIYFDFSGYSDMAIGLGRMFGFEFLENFNYPYISKTVTEFWRRWHISLSTWFRDYVYFPLGGSRVKTKSRAIFNLFVVWLITGIWHGANWTFILWGVYYGTLIAAEKMLDLPKRLPKYKKTAIAYQIFTILSVMMGWVLFRADNLYYAGRYIKALFGLRENAFVDNTAIFYIREYALLIAAGIVCSMPIAEKIQKILSQRTDTQNISVAVAGIFQMLFFVIGISYLVMNAHNPFIYFNF